MDMLTRLIAGSGASPTKQRASTAAERLATCKSICNALTQTWRGGGLERDDDAVLAYTTKLLQRLESILHDESRRAAPHSCLRYVASSQVYIIITKLAISSRDTGIISAAAQLFHILINGEAEGLLDSKLFTRSLLDLVCYATIEGTIIVEEKLITELIELLFEIATKIRLDPDILPAWFFPDRESIRGQNAADETRKSQFPLFFVLVQYVHHDGSVGDFARTALLYLTETASKFKPLEMWMIESDLAPQMASGLGALYSRLSRQSTALTARAAVPPIITLSDSLPSVAFLSETPPDVQQDVKAFFSYLAFWQDTLSHCQSAEVHDTLLDHFQVLFVQQLLYPSLLESSDVEGGSTAAVIAHLARILVALDHLELVDLILGYLLASPSMPREPGAKAHRRQRMSISRRKSIDHLKALAEVADSPSPNLFSLLDLVVMSLKSSHAETINASLKLLTVIIGKHHCHVRTSLFRLHMRSPLGARRGVKQLHGYLGLLFNYAATIGAHEELDESYQGALLDGQQLLEQHSCLVTPAPDAMPRETRRSTIDDDCKLYGALVMLLRNFFANDTATNLYLTEALTALLACEHMDLQGWLLPVGDKDQLLEDHSADNVTVILGELSEQVRQWRSQFPEWSDLIAARRAELAEDDPQSPPRNERRGGSDQRGKASGGPNSPAFMPSRPTTPRGRPSGKTDPGSADIAMSKPTGPRLNVAARRVGQSPLRRSTQPHEEEAATPPVEEPVPSSATTATLLRTQVTLLSQTMPEEASASLPLLAGRKQTASPEPTAQRLNLPGSTNSGTATPSGLSDILPRDQASLSHVLTGAIILQEFILEIAAVVQLRATFFDEVDVHANVPT